MLHRGPLAVERILIELHRPIDVIRWDYFGLMLRQRRNTRHAVNGTDELSSVASTASM